MTSFGRYNDVVITPSVLWEGGCASFGLFGGNLADLIEYLSSSFGVFLDDEIILHLLWAGDLSRISISDKVEGIQKTN